MNILKHPLLLALSGLVEHERTTFTWLDLYAAQFIADAFVTQDVNTPVLTGKTGDLFDASMSDDSRLNSADIIAISLMCSQLVSQGKTHLCASDIPQDLMATLKSCGWRPSFHTTNALLEGLMRINQIEIVRVVACKQHDLSEPQVSPLVLFQDRIYLAKYWHLHQTFECWLQSRTRYRKPLEEHVLAHLSDDIRKVFVLDHKAEVGDVNWQAVAAAHTLLNPFSLITGGPGTGKTTTAASVLFLLMRKHQYQLTQHTHTNAQQVDTLKVRLLAPTGKAAVKLADSIRHQLKSIELRVLGNVSTPLNMSDCLPETGETVHRFLYEMGGLRDSVQHSKRFNSNDVLVKRSQAAGDVLVSNKPIDIIIIDESSMMDLALMVELVRLIPPNTQLILLGDHYQLPAVDPGQVFTECVERFSKQTQDAGELAGLSALTGYAERRLTEYDNAHQQAHDSTESALDFQPLCALRKTYRFDGDLKIAAEYIKSGNTLAFKKQYGEQGVQYQVNSAVTWYNSDLNETVHYVNMVKAYAAYFDLVANRAPLTQLAEQFERYQLLCSTLEGPLGVHVINTYIEQRFQSACLSNGKIIGELYHGKAILVSRNHPHLGIYNGDIGFVIQDDDSTNLNVHFPVAKQRPIIIPPARIKSWQTAYAMTVHKSQGSEYENVGVVLADYAKELLSRALLYTALTRSKHRCDIWVSSDALHKAFEE